VHRPELLGFVAVLPPRSFTPINVPIFAGARDIPDFLVNWVAPEAPRFPDFDPTANCRPESCCPESCSKVNCCGEAKAVVKVYPVAHLLSEDGETSPEVLANLICRMVAPQSWDQHGGYGCLDYYPLGKGLVVRATPAVHDELQGFLGQLEAMVTPTRKNVSSIEPVKYVPEPCPKDCTRKGTECPAPCRDACPPPMSWADFWNGPQPSVDPLQVFTFWNGFFGIPCEPSSPGNDEMEDPDVTDCPNGFGDIFLPEGLPLSFDLANPYKHFHQDVLCPNSGHCTRHTGGYFGLPPYATVKVVKEPQREELIQVLLQMGFFH
jgi:hypothetical protein